MPVTKLKSNGDLLLVGLLALISLLLIAVVPSSIMRIVLGLPLVLFYPGYILALAIFPQKSTLPGMERLMMSPVFSILAVVSIALILNVSPWGIALLPMAIALALFISAATAVAWYRRRRLDENERYKPEITLDLAFWRKYNRVDRILAGVLLVVMAAAIGTLVYYLATPNEKERFTEFYVLGPEGKMMDYPLELTAEKTATVSLVIANQERQPTSYRVEMKMEGATQREIGAVTLDHGEEWQQEVRFTPANSGNQKVEFLLYKQDQSEVYRSVYLLIKVR